MLSALVSILACCPTVVTTGTPVLASKEYPIAAEVKKLWLGRVRATLARWM